MPREIVQEALDSGWKEGWTIFSMLRTGVYFYVGEEDERTLTFTEIAGHKDFWDALKKSRGWSEEETEEKFSWYIRLTYRNEDTSEFWENL